MKKLFYGIGYFTAILLAGASFLAACTNTEEDLFAGNSIPINDQTIIAQLGFDPGTAFEMGDYYVVSGDILLQKDDLNVYLQDEIATRHAATYNKVSSINIANVRVGFDSNVLRNYPQMQSALQEAIDAWNSIPNNELLFRLVASAEDVMVRLPKVNEYVPLGTAAMATFPGGNKPGREIILFEIVNMNSKKQVYNLVHELGHTIGFRHTNWRAMGESLNNPLADLIPGIPETDSKSVMNGGTANTNWSGFSANDKIALQTLYPPKVTFTNISISGSSTTSLSSAGNYTVNYSGPAADVSYEWIGGITSTIIYGAHEKTVTIKYNSAGNKTLTARLRHPSDGKIYDVTKTINVIDYTAAPSVSSTPTKAYPHSQVSVVAVLPNRLQAEIYEFTRAGRVVVQSSSNNTYDFTLPAAGTHKIECRAFVNGVWTQSGSCTVTVVQRPGPGGPGRPID